MYLWSLKEEIQMSCFSIKKCTFCLAAARDGFFPGCRRLIELDGCFLKGLTKGQLLVAVGRDGDSQMLPIAWAIIEKETIECWASFIQHLQSTLCIGDGLGWSVVIDMQKVCNNFGPNLLQLHLYLNCFLL